MARQRTWTRGFTMVELMITGAVIAILAALAMYGMRRYINDAKSAEAKNSVGAISRLAVLAFEERVASQLLAEAAVSAVANQSLCTSAIPVPAAVPHGSKYQPAVAVGVDFGSGNQQTGWLCLGFSTSQPVYYQYNYNQGGSYITPALGGPNPGANGFEVTAVGDLNGENNAATQQYFARSGVTAGSSVKMATQIFINNGVD